MRAGVRSGVRSLRRVMSLLWLGARWGAAAIAVSRLAKAATAPAPVRPTMRPHTSIRVVIPARDEATRISPLLDAVVGAPGVDEVIVVDDQSSDRHRRHRPNRRRTRRSTAANARMAGRARPGPCSRGSRRPPATGSSRSTPTPVRTRCSPPRSSRGRSATGSTCSPSPGASTARPPGQPVAASGDVDHARLSLRPTRRGRPRPSGRWRTASAWRSAVPAFSATASTLGSGGLEAVKGEVVEDIALARQLAGDGAAVGFLDAGELLTVRMFESFEDTWHGWGRSLALPGVEPRRRQLLDLALVDPCAGAAAAPTVDRAGRRARHRAARRANRDADRDAHRVHPHRRRLLDQSTCRPPGSRRDRTRNPAPRRPGLAGTRYS